MKALAKQLAQAAKVLRSFNRVTYPAKDNCLVNVRLEKGYSLYVRKEKP